MSVGGGGEREAGVFGDVKRAYVGYAEEEGEEMGCWCAEGEWWWSQWGHCRSVVDPVRGRLCGQLAIKRRSMRCGQDNT